MAISRKPHDKDARSRVLELAEALVEHPDLQADIRQCHELFREAHSEREHRENLHAQLDESSHEMFNALGIYFDPVHIVEEAVDWLLLRYQPIWDRMTSAPATPDANIHADASTNDAPATPDANIHADASTNDLLDRRNIAIALEYAVEGGEWRASLPPLRASLDERYGYPNPSYVDIRRRQYDQAGQIVERNYWTSETPKPDDAGYTVTVMLRHNATVEDARRAFRETLRRMEGSLDHAPDAGLPRGRPTEFATHVALYRERWLSRRQGRSDEKFKRMVLKGDIVIRGLDQPIPKDTLESKLQEIRWLKPETDVAATLASFYARRCLERLRRVLGGD